MLGFNGFERHFVEMVAKYYSEDLYTIAVMRGVSRAWRSGSETQWNRMKVKWVISTGSLHDVTVFEKDEAVLKAALLDACKRKPQIIIEILKATFDQFKNAFAATLRAANDSETKFESVTDSTKMNNTTISPATDAGKMGTDSSQNMSPDSMQNMKRDSIRK